MHITKSASELQLHGRFDAHEIQLFRSRLEEAILTSPNVRVDLQDVEFVDSTALSELVRGMKHCREAGGDLVLVSPSDPVRIILELTKLDAAFIID